MRRWRSRTKKLGQLPGTLIHLGEQKMEKARVTAVDYNANSCYKELSRFYLAPETRIE